MGKSPLRYPGGKSKVANLLLKYMPVDTTEYREPFVGGGGVFFNLDPKNVEKRWINDLNDGLIAVYKAFAERPEKFIAACRTIEAMKPGEDEVSTKGTGKEYNKRLGELFEKFKYNTEMDQALRYLFINRTVWAGRVNYDPAFESRLYYSNPQGWNIVKRPDFLENIAKHISGTKITNGSYIDSLSTPGENVWIYLDPPYVVDTKLNKGSKLYQHGFSMRDHLQFVEDCRHTKHRICISYDDVPEVHKLFANSDALHESILRDTFHVYRHTWTYSGTSQDKKTIGKELVITNYPRNEQLFRDIGTQTPTVKRSLVCFSDAD